MNNCKQRIYYRYYLNYLKKKNLEKIFDVNQFGFFLPKKLKCLKKNLFIFKMFTELVCTKRFLIAPANFFSNNALFLRSVGESSKTFNFNSSATQYT